jgi:hypothetical protein
MSEICPIKDEEELCARIDFNEITGNPKKSYQQWQRRNHPDRGGDTDTFAQVLNSYDACADKINNKVNNDMCSKIPKDRLKKNKNTSNPVKSTPDAKENNDTSKKDKKEYVHMQDTEEEEPDFFTFNKPPPSANKKPTEDEPVEKEEPVEVEEPKKNLTESKTAKCVRRVANWPYIKRENRFDKKFFDGELTKKDISNSPKMEKLLETIAKLDANDMKESGKLFKHFIYSDIKDQGYGAKIIASAFVASGYTSCFDKKGAIVSPVTENSMGLGLLSSSAVYGEPTTPAKKKKILGIYNNRPDNIQGENMRFIIFDSGFKEGIDLFDVKYVHIFEPQRTTADFIQAVGRATRLCGQKGLTFVPNKGWMLHVFTYNLTLTGGKTIHDLYTKYSNLNLSELKMKESLEKIAIESAVDFDLNFHINKFAPEATEAPEAPEANVGQIGGAKNKVDYNTLSCSDGTCGNRSTKSVPFTVAQFRAIYDTFGTDYFSEKPSKKYSSTKDKRQFYCTLISKYPAYCERLVQFIRGEYTIPLKIRKKNKNEKDLDKGVRFSEATENLKTQQKNTLALNKNSPKKAPKKGKKANESSLALWDEDQKDTNTLALYNTNSPKKKKKGKKENGSSLALWKDVGENVGNTWDTRWDPDDDDDADEYATIDDDDAEYDDKNKKEDEHFFEFRKNESFEETRSRINKEFSRYKYDKIEIENVCEQGNVNDAQKIVDFTPSQDFISHYFTPKSNQKGLLAWHSVGTGKTCMAIATKSKTWEKMGYTILWVTRTTLKSDIWKNMFEKVCDHIIKEKLENGEKIPSHLTQMKDIRKHLTKKFMQPCSFKQFSNAMKGSGQLYEDLVRKNGKDDPLKKTLVIVDEVHKFFATDLIFQERPDFPAIEKAVFKSYAKSGEDSCRVLLMSATPILENPMDFIKMLNLFIEKPEERMPVTMSAFLRRFPVDENMEFLRYSVQKFKSIVNGKISYLDQRWDPRKFTQPVFHNINVPIKISKINDDCQDTLEADEAIASSTFSSNLKQCEKFKTEDKSIDELKKQILQESKNIQNKVATDEKEIINLKNSQVQALKYSEKGNKTRIRSEFAEKTKKVRDRLLKNKRTLKEILKLSKKNDKKKYDKCLKDMERGHEQRKKSNKSKFKLCVRTLKNKNKLYINFDQNSILKETCKISENELNK